MNSLAHATDVLQLLSDPTRVRLLALLAERELTVAELTRVLEIAQSRVSTHLGRLREAGLLRDRRQGTSTYYAFDASKPSNTAHKVWSLVHAGVRDGVLDRDRQRCVDLLEARRKAQAWPDALAGEMERHYSPGRTWESMARALVGLVHLGRVLDVGSGDGSVARLLAARAVHITCLDRSERMIAAARERLSAHDNVACLVGDMHALCFDDESFDEVLALNCLVHADKPARVVAECARVLRPGGDLVLTTLAAHEHHTHVAAFDHRQTGFAPRALRTMLARAGLSVQHCELTSRERRAPHFENITVFARRPELPRSSTRRRKARITAHGA